MLRRERGPTREGRGMPVISEEVRALIGIEGEVVTAPLPISEDGLRRFVQAVMEEDPVHWDAEAARDSRYGCIVAPPLFPLHSFVRPPGTPDPLDRLGEDPDWDGVPRGDKDGLPRPALPFQRLVNGGTEASFFRLAAVGDVISARSRYVDISEREARSGPMVMVKTETTFTNQHGDVLAAVTKTAIWR